MMSPEWHYEEADRLLNLEVVQRDPTLPIARAYVALAAVHAQLAQCPARYGVDGVVYGSTRNAHDNYPGAETRTATGDRL